MPAASPNPVAASTLLRPGRITWSTSSRRSDGDAPTLPTADCQWSMGCSAIGCPTTVHSTTSRWPPRCSACSSVEPRPCPRWWHTGCGSYYGTPTNWRRCARTRPPTCPSRVRRGPAPPPPHGGPPDRPESRSRFTTPRSNRDSGSSPCSRRPIGMSANTHSRTSSSGTGPSPAHWRSAVDSIFAWATTWPASKSLSWCPNGCGACRITASSTRRRSARRPASSGAGAGCRWRCEMWSYRIIAPYQFERTSIAEKTPDSLADGQVLLRFLAAGVCGSDMPAFRGVRGKLPGDDGRSGAEKDGYPIHEVVGEVIASRHRQHRPGDRVVGWASAFDGLMERVVTDGNQVAAYDPTLSPGQAVGLQPLACVLYAIEQLPDLNGLHVGVIGQGSIGLLFSCAAKAAGARRVTGVDPIDRAEIATKFGVDTYARATSDRWVSQLAREDRPNVVIEAVGHQVATLSHAIEAAAPGGTVFYFGVPDDDSYPISMRTMLRHNLTLKSGVAVDRPRMLELANKFAAEHPGLLAKYLTHTFGIDDVQAAFELAGHPVPGRGKIAITETGAS